MVRGRGGTASSRRNRRQDDPASSYTDAQRRRLTPSRLWRNCACEGDRVPGPLDDAKKPRRRVEIVDKITRLVSTLTPDTSLLSPDSHKAMDTRVFGKISRDFALLRLHRDASPSDWNRLLLIPLSRAVLPGPAPCPGEAVSRDGSTAAISEEAGKDSIVLGRGIKGVLLPFLLSFLPSTSHPLQILPPSLTSTRPSPPHHHHHTTSSTTSPPAMGLFGIRRLFPTEMERNTFYVLTVFPPTRTTLKSTDTVMVTLRGSWYKLCDSVDLVRSFRSSSLETSSLTLSSSLLLIVL